jgi:hypothetical protein
MRRFSRLSDIKGVSYRGFPERSDPASSPEGSAKDRMPDTSMQPERLIRNLETALELPGEPLDYHFLIQQTCGLLFWRRRKYPGALEEVERLARLDVELVEACPGMIEHEPGEHFRVESFLRLVRIYEREGSLQEALEFAERGAKCHQEGLAKRAADLRARLAALEAEDV